MKYDKRAEFGHYEQFRLFIFVETVYFNESFFKFFNFFQKKLLTSEKDYDIFKVQDTLEERKSRDKGYRTTKNV